MWALLMVDVPCSSSSTCFTHIIFFHCVSLYVSCFFLFATLRVDYADHLHTILHVIVPYTTPFTPQACPTCPWTRTAGTARGAGWNSTCSRPPPAALKRIWKWVARVRLWVSMLFVVCVVCCVLCCNFLCCSLFVAWCSFIVVRCLLFVVCCVLYCTVTFVWGKHLVLSMLVCLISSLESHFYLPVSYQSF